MTATKGIQLTPSSTTTTTTSGTETKVKKKVPRLYPITKENIQQVKSLNNVTFPIRYHDRFYDNIIQQKERRFNQCVYDYGCGGGCTNNNKTVIGAISCRIQPSYHPNDKTTKMKSTVGTPESPKLQGHQSKTLYIMTLAVLAPYRGRGIGSQLVQSILEYCQYHNEMCKETKQFDDVIGQVMLHVHSANRDAIQFYKRKFQFLQGELIENYYRRIEEPHCYILYKMI